MKYVIKNIPTHPLHIDTSCNRNFGDDIKTFAGEEVLELFRQSFFGVYLDMPQSNFQGQFPV